MVAILILFISFFAQAEIIVYENLDNIVSTRNGLIKAEEANVEGVSKRGDLLRRSFLPKVEASVGGETYAVGKQKTYTQPFWKAEANFNLFRSGIDDIEDDIREIAKDGSRINLDLTKRDKLLEARTLYWKLMAEKHMIRVQNKAIEVIQTNLALVRKKLVAGLTTHSDVLEFELENTLLNQHLKELVLEEDILKNQLAVVLGIDEHQSVEILEDFVHPGENEGEKIQILTLKTPQYQYEHIQKEGYSLMAKKKSRYWMPQLDLYTQYLQFTERAATPPLVLDRIPTDQLQQWAIGLRLKFDLFDSLESPQEEAYMRAEAISADYKSRYTHKMLEAKEHELRHDLAQYHELLHDADESAKKSRVLLDVTLKEYLRGLKNGQDVLYTTGKNLEFEKRVFELYRHYYLTKVQLQSMQGV